jgi:hypothetical protein
MKKRLEKMEAVSTAPSPSPAGKDEFMAKLTQLTELKKQGLLTDEEFQAAKKKLLG